MSTERQIAANRQNAQHSTGPRTPDGKATASRNNTRHGLRATTPVIPRVESPEEWEHHRATTIAGLNPDNALEEALAELEQILAEIEAGELGLEESLIKYERGNFLIHHCRGVLNTAEKQIELLSKAPDGGLQSTPLDEQ